MMCKYEIQYTVRETRSKHKLVYRLDTATKSHSDELHRFKAITRALLTSPEFTDVGLFKAFESEEMVEL